MILEESDVPMSCATCGASFTARVPDVLEIPETDESLERARFATCGCSAKVKLDRSFLVLQPERVLPLVIVVGDEAPEARADHLERLFGVARARLGNNWHPAMAANPFAVASDRAGEALRSSPSRGHRRWLDAFMDLHGANTAEDMMMACSAFARLEEPVAGSPVFEEALQTGAELLAAAESRGDDERRAELEMDRAMIQFARERGLAALDDALVSRYPESLAPAVAAFIAGVSQGSMDHARLGSMLPLAQTIVTHADFGAGSSAFRRQVLLDLSTMLTLRYDWMGEDSDFEEARRVLMRVVEISRPLLPEERGRTLNKLAGSYLRSFDRTGTAEDLDRAISLLHQALGQSETWPSAAQAIGNLGIALRKRGVLRGSLSDLDLAVDVLGRSAKDAGGLLNLANALRARFQLKGSIADLERAVEYLKLAVQTTPDQGSARVHALTELGTALVRRNEVRQNAPDLSAAVDVLNEAVRRADADSRMEHVAAHRLSDALEARYEYSRDLKDLKALDRIRTQLLSRARAGTTEHVELMLALGKTWLLRFERRPDPATAEHAEELLRAAVNAAPEPSLLRGAARLALVHLAVAERRAARTGSWARPDRLREVAREAVEHAFSPAQAAIAAREWADAASADARERALARDDAGAAALWHEAAEAATKALTAMMLLADAQSDTRRVSLSLRRSQGLAAHAAYANAKAGRLREAVLALERGRARLLSRGLTWARQQLAGWLQGEHREIVQRYLDITAQIADIEGALATRPQPATTIDELFQQRVRREDMEERLRLRRRDLDAAADALRAATGTAELLGPPSFTRVQEVVREAGVPAVYVAVAGENSFALVVREASVEVLWLEATRADLDRLLITRRPWHALTLDERMELHTQHVISVLYDSVEAVLRPGEELSPFAETVDEPAKKAGVIGGLLAGQLGWVPLQPAVAAAVKEMETLFAELAAIPERSILLVLCGPLALLPIHATLRGKTVRHAVSIAALPPRPTIGPLQGPVLAVGDPQPVAPPLRWAQEEARIVKASFDEGPPLVLEEATRDAVIKGLKDAAVLHLACHGVHDANDPLASKLLLAQGTTLTARDIYKLALSHVRLAVLSACRSATADATHIPDENLSLSTAFLGAGVPSVIGTLWQVDDRATGLLMSELYRLCKQGMAPADALRLARDWLSSATPEGIDQREAEVTILHRDVAPAGTSGDGSSGDASHRIDGSHPFSEAVFWAPFVLYGW